MPTSQAFGCGRRPTAPSLNPPHRSAGAGVAELRSFFSQAIQPRIIGVTPKLDGALPERFAREAEVAMWLRDSGQPWLSWAVLDDQPWLFKPFNPRLVLCDPDVGLTDCELGRLSALLVGRA